MALTSLRSLVKIGFGFCLVAAASPQADAMSLRNAKLETLSFSALDGWQDDDHAAAFATFLKSCRAILNANKTIRSARPLLAGLSRRATVRRLPVSLTASGHVLSLKTTSSRSGSCQAASLRGPSPVTTKRRSTVRAPKR